MSWPHRNAHIVTPTQFAFSTVLTERALTGKQMRAELARCGVHRSELAFYRVIQRLKQENLVTARRIPRDEGEYRGAQSRYELTQAGNEAVAVMRGLYRKAARRLRLRRWRRTRNLWLSRRSKRSAERAGASRSERQ